MAASSSGKRAGIGGELAARAGRDVTVTIRVRDPQGENRSGVASGVARVDLIAGEVRGLSPDRDLDANPTTKVARRFTSAEWTRRGEVLTMTHTFRNVRQSMYVRVRGTNTSELEPAPDGPGENPWNDLWFYSNPVFIRIE